MSQSTPIRSGMTRLTIATATVTDGTGAIARFNQPYAITVDSGGNVYVADLGNVPPPAQPVQRTE